MRSLRREPVLLLALLAVVALVLTFIVYPQVQVVIAPGPSGYVDFLQGGTWIGPLRNSVEVTLLSTTTAVLLGFVYAYAMVYSHMPWKPFFRVIGILPLLSPPFVVAASYLLLFGPRGIVTYGVFGQSPIIFGLFGIWGVQTIAYFPFAYQLIADVLSRSDARMEQAARNLGAGPCVLDAASAGAARALRGLFCSVPRARGTPRPGLRDARRERLHRGVPDQPHVHRAAFRVRRDRDQRRCAPQHADLQRRRGRVLGGVRALRGLARPARDLAGPRRARLPADHAGGDSRDLLRDRLPHSVQPGMARLGQPRVADH